MVQIGMQQEVTVPLYYGSLYQPQVGQLAPPLTLVIAHLSMSALCLGAQGPRGRC